MIRIQAYFRVTYDVIDSSGSVKFGTDSQHLPPCALRADPTRLPHTICAGTTRACENGGPPPLPFTGGAAGTPTLCPPVFCGVEEQAREGERAARGREIGLLSL